MDRQPHSPSPSPIGEGDHPSRPIVERGVIVQGQRIASALSDAPRELLGRLPLVILPEIGFVWGDYRPLLEQFAGSRRVFALDWPGFGASAKPAPADFAYTLANYTDTLARWLDSLGIARAVVLGNGVGAAVALRHALAHPQRVAGLALLGPLGVTPPAGLVGMLASRFWRSPAWLRRSEPTLTSLALGPTTETTNGILARRRAERATADFAASLVAAAALIGSLPSANPESGKRPPADDSPVNQNNPDDPANYPDAPNTIAGDILAQAHTLTMPSLVVRGALDPLCTAGDARRLAEALGTHGALEVTLPDAGHLPFIQQPMRCIQAVEGVIMTAEAIAAQG